MQKFSLFYTIFRGFVLKLTGKTSVHSVHFFQGTITNILEENVLQPLLVSTSAIQLASETVRSILKIDDIVSTSSM